MRVLALVHEYGVPARRFIRNGIDYLRENGVEVRIITTKLADDRFAGKDVHVIPFPTAQARRRESWNRFLRKFRKFTWRFFTPKPFDAAHYYLEAKSPRFSKKLNQIIAEFQPDLVHIHFAFSAPLYFKNTTRWKHIPTLITFRGIDATAFMNHQKYLGFFKEILAFPNVYTASVCRALKEQLLKKNLSIRNHFILYSSIDINFYKRDTQNLSKNPVRFLQISSFNPKKGHPITLQAFQRFAEENPSKDFRLTLAGGGSLLAEMKNLARQLNLENRVDFIGKVTPEEGRKLMENSHVFVHHSLTPPSGDKEGIPNAIIEAMAMEMPILSSSHSGIPELVEHGLNGLLVEEGDIAEYATRIEEIYSWNYLRENREKIIKNFSLQKHGQTLTHIYNSILPKRIQMRVLNETAL